MKQLFPPASALLQVLNDKSRNTLDNPCIHLEESTLGCNQAFLQFLKTGLTFLSPFELGILLHQLRHRFCNLREIPYESSVVSCQSKKTLDLSNCCWGLPLGHSFNFSGIYCYTFSRYNVSEESNFLQPKLTFAKLGI